MLQSPNPALQLAMVQLPIAHPGVALASVQALVHPPQFWGSVRMSDSQPSAAMPLQSPNPALQLATVQLPMAHPGTALASMHL
jgi:hypothetical protein